MRIISVLLALFIGISSSFSQLSTYDSGGTLSKEQAAYDVIFYDMDLQIDPEKRRIDGSVTVQARVLEQLAVFILDLDTLLEVQKVSVKGVEKPFLHQNGKLTIDLESIIGRGETVNIKVFYGGVPRVAPMPPWKGGFTWSKTKSGDHWIATTCQGEGADVWWPVKEHVSDKPDSMALHIRVPEPLVVATNGRFIKKETHNDRTSTYHWFISTPISTYNVALNIAPYRTIETTFESIAQDSFPVIFYVLPENYENGEKLFPQFLDHLRFFEELLGPYPFRADKYGVVQTPHLGMEHQTIIAYGANFSNASMTGFDWGFDALHQHELAHEWWGNLVTNADWKDMWLHEGFGSYMQPLYVEHLKGEEAYHKYMARNRWFTNSLAVAPRESQTSKEIYRAPIYTKGAWVLHTLRYLIGDEAFFRSLRRMAYPEPDMEKATDGSQVRFADTNDFLEICEKESNRQLDWFFDVYLRQPKLPVLYSKIDGNKLSLRWESPTGEPFPMPVEVEIDGEIKRYEIPKKGLKVKFKKGQKPVVDPDGWLLFKKGR